MNVIIQDLLQSQNFTNVFITQEHILSINDLLQSQGIEPISVTQVYTLAVDNLLQYQFIESPSITQTHNVTIQDMLQGGVNVPKNTVRRWDGTAWRFVGYVNGTVVYQDVSQQGMRHT